MLACSFLIESSSKLLVTRTGIKARLSLILGQIRRLILELLALELQKFHTFELEYLLSQLANLDQILFVGVGERLHKVLGQMDLSILDSGERLLPFGLLVFFSIGIVVLELCPFFDVFFFFDFPIVSLWNTVCREPLQLGS